MATVTPIHTEIGLTIDDATTCAVCDKKLLGGHGWVCHHGRLNVWVHSTCDLGNVRGEDITHHAMYWVSPDDPTAA